MIISMLKSILSFSIVFLLIINTKYIAWCARTYDTNDNAHGLRFAGNNKIFVGAFNTFRRYALRSLSKSSNKQCVLTYPRPELYVYSLAVVDLPGITANNSELAAFVQIAENMTTSSNSLTNVVLSVFILNISSEACAGDKTYIKIIETVVWTEAIHQEYMLLKVDPQQKYVYVFTDIEAFSYELATNRIDQRVLMNDTLFWQNRTKISTRSFDLTNEWALLAAYARAPNPVRSRYYVLFLELCPLRLITSSTYYDYGIDMSEALVYNSYYDMSVSIAPHNSLVAIGAPSLNSVTLCEISRIQNGSQSDWTIRLQKEAITSTVASGNSGFGRSVAWLDDEGSSLLVVLLDTVKQQVWSLSELRVYSNISISTKVVDGIPEFVFPNSQQQILDRYFTTKLSMLQLASIANNLMLLFEESSIFYIPSAPFGLCSVMVNTDTFTYNNVFEARTCVGGSYKNKSSPGPCTPCPAQTKSVLVKDDKPVTAPMTMCIPCERGSFCPLGASGDVNLSDVASYTQTFVYPNGGPTDNYDDLLLQNFFTFGVTSAHCLIVSPIFWLLLIFVLCFTLWLAMRIMKSREKRASLCSLNIQQRRVKLFLKHVDIIHQGEHWVSGLASFAIVVIIGMTAWFAADYVKLYPIETSPEMRAACDANIRNARFDNALQLPLSMSDGSQWMIFDLLQAQPFSMSIDVINTAARCENITVRQNRISVPPVNLKKQNCSLTNNNVTVSFSFTLPAHQTTVQVDVIGPYFIGALRLCLLAPPDRSQRANNVHELNVCSLFFTPNQTIGSYTDFTVNLVKVVNVTQPLSNDGDTIYDGRWYPKISSDALSDELVLEQYGQYIRYVNDRTTFVIRFSEESYFLQNNQRPIVQVAALAFHTLLFISLIIEIFATSFLLFKLCCLPMVRTVRAAFLPEKKRNCQSKQAGSESVSQVIRSLLHLSRRITESKFKRH